MSKQREDQEARWPDGSRLLISEPPLLVLPSLAVLVGLNEAIFLQQLHYWLHGKAAKQRDGRAWIYNTYEEWHQQLPFWSERTIRRIVGTLEKEGLVLSTTAYNAQRVDQTKWYSIDYAALERLTNRADQVAKLATWGGQDERLQAANLATSVPETTAETSHREREVEASKLRPAQAEFVDRYDEARLTLLPYVEDFARDLGDQAPLAASVSRVVGIYKRSGLGLEPFTQRLYQARAITKERTGSIRAEAAAGGPWAKKPKMAYFFAVLEDLATSHIDQRAD